MLSFASLLPSTCTTCALALPPSIRSEVLSIPTRNGRRSNRRRRGTNTKISSCSSSTKDDEGDEPKCPVSGRIGEDDACRCRSNVRSIRRRHDRTNTKAERGAFDHWKGFMFRAASYYEIGARRKIDWKVLRFLLIFEDPSFSPPLCKFRVGEERRIWLKKEWAIYLRSWALDPMLRWSLLWCCCLLLHFFD